MTKIWFDLLFWVEVVLLIALVALMLWRRLQKEFPFLFGYFVTVTITVTLQRGFLLFVSMFSTKYFYAYWLTEALAVSVSFAVLYEVFLVRLFPSSHTTPIYRYLFPAVIFLGVLLAVIVLVRAPHHAPNMLSAVVGETTLALNFLQVALLLFFFVIVIVMGRGWEWHEFGVALGYGVYALSKLITTAVRARANYSTTVMDQLPTIGYFAALVIWLIYLSREYRPPEVNIPMEIVNKAQSWDKLLREITGRRR